MIHTKLSCSNSGSNNTLTSKETTDDKNFTRISPNTRESMKIGSAVTTIVQNFIANIFFREVNLILYDDCKHHLYKKNNIASIFFDDFIICYIEEVNYNFNAIFVITIKYPNQFYKHF